MTVKQIKGTRQELFGGGDIGQAITETEWLISRNQPSPTPTPTADKPVRFIDYDGTILYTYTPEEFLALNNFPESPVHEGLTSRGWAYSSLANAKAYVEKYGCIDIGHQYRVTDGTTKIFITMSGERREPVLGLGVNGSVDIDWGDGSEHTTLTGNSLSTYVHTNKHVYASKGDYVISLKVTGSAAFLAEQYGNSKLLCKENLDKNESTVYYKAVQKIFIGDNISLVDSKLSTNAKIILIPDTITELPVFLFFDDVVEYIILPNSITAINNNMGGPAKIVTIPDSVTSIGRYVFNGQLKSCLIPESVITIGEGAFTECSELEKVIIPDSVTSLGDNAFGYCKKLKDLYLSKNITSYGDSLFEYCDSLTELIVPNNITAIGDSVFSNSGLTTITLHNNITEIGSSAFFGTSITQITIPNDIVTIKNNCFSSDKILDTIIIPSSVTKIEMSAFAYCYGLKTLKFSSATPPTIYSNTFQYLPTDCTIYVPTGSLSAYTSAQYYPSSSTYTYVEY